MTAYKTTVTANKVDITLVKTNHTVSLSRTGGQGAKGDSVASIVFNSNNDIVVTMVNGAGEVIEVINAGNLFQNVFMSNIQDVTSDTPSDGDILLYDGSASKYAPHSFTTTNVTDIDNSGKTDGAMFLYDASSSKYKATTQINNANTVISGGTF